MISAGNGKDQGDLTLDTGTLTYSDIHGESKEKHSYTQLSGSYGDFSKSNTDEQGNSWGIEGSYSNQEKEQIVRATVGEGTIIVRDNPEQDLSDLNRDTDKAYEITKDESETTEVYVTSSALDALDGMVLSEEEKAAGKKNTFERWKTDLQDYIKSGREGIERINDLDNGIAELATGDKNAEGLLSDSAIDTITHGFDVVDATARETLNPTGSKGENTTLAERVDARLRGTDDANAIREGSTKDEEGERVYEINNATANTVEEVNETLQEASDLVSENRGLENVETGVYAANDGASATIGEKPDGSTVIGVNVQEGRTDLAEGGELVNSIVHEQEHRVTGSETEALAAGSGAQAEWEFKNRLEGRVTHTGPSSSEWLEENKDHEAIQAGNQTFTNLDNQKYSELTLPEAQEFQKLYQLADTDKQKRLEAAACFLVNCSDHLPESDDDYAYRKQMQAEGELYAAEIEELQATGLFERGLLGSANDILAANDEFFVRGSGVKQAYEGVAEAARKTVLGVALCGKVPGLCGIGGDIISEAVSTGKDEFSAGVEKATGEFVSPAGDRLTGSYNPETHPGERNRVEEVAVGTAVLAAETLVAKGSGKVVNGIAKNSDSVIGEVADIVGDLLGAGKKGKGDGLKLDDGASVGKVDVPAVDDKVIANAGDAAGSVQGRAGTTTGKSVDPDTNFNSPSRENVQLELDKLPDGQGSNYHVRQNSDGSFSAVRNDVNEGQPLRVTEGGNLYSPTAPGDPIPNAVDGRRRHLETEAELKEQYSGGSVQSEQYLRDADGRIVRDPVTGEGRRIDHVVIQDGRVVDSVETTSPSAPKAPQADKENRIRESGGNHVRDRETGCILEVNCDTREVRRE